MRAMLNGLLLPMMGYDLLYNYKAYKSCGHELAQVQAPSM